MTASPVPVRQPEVLAPAGDEECMRAAIENGADAVYFGLQSFNARHRATNFDDSRLAETMTTLHRHGVKGYVTLNTLVFPRELDDIEPVLWQVADAGADAIIVQDLGLLQLARETCPDLELHASTQMTVTSAGGLKFLEDLGVERVVVARELSIAEIKKLQTQTTIPLEVFVHGALCVAYSGQCLTSEALGGRSANRGQCAQACRLPYEIVCDGETQDLDNVRYLLSPQDLAAYDLIGELHELGVAGLKIEGRLKSPEYVANITAHYRRAVDAAQKSEQAKFTTRDVDEMELSFSRGFSSGWLHGNNHKVLVQGRNPRKHGLLLGEVLSFGSGRVRVELRRGIKRGDGVVFDRGRPEEKEEGGRVYEVFHDGVSLTDEIDHGIVELAFGRGAIDWQRVEVGQKVWKTDDPELSRKLRKSFENERTARRVAVDLQVRARVGEPLDVRAIAANGATARAASPKSLEEARRHPLTEEVLRDQLGRLGSSVYDLRDVNAQIDGEPMVPLSVLGAVRRQLIDELEASLRNRTTPPRTAQLPRLRERARGTDEATAGPQSFELWITCRTLEHVRAAVRAGERQLYADLQDIRECAEAVRIAHQGGAQLVITTPRIEKPGEEGIFKLLARAEPDAILVRNLGGLRFFKAAGFELIADFSLNCANELTAQLLRDHGVTYVTTAYDLDHHQLFDLCSAFPPSRLEVVIHQHMPMFHMEHCVFCAFLSPGTDKTNCGRPCDDHKVELRDHNGLEHPLKADVGCRNTLFNAVPQSAAEHVGALREHGVRRFRVELLDHAASDVGHLIGLYRSLFAGELSGRDVWTQLNALNHMGITRGPLGP